VKKHRCELPERRKRCGKEREREQNAGECDLLGPGERDTEEEQCHDVDEREGVSDAEHGACGGTPKPHHRGVEHPVADRTVHRDDVSVQLRTVQHLHRRRQIEAMLKEIDHWGAGRHRDMCGGDKEAGINDRPQLREPITDDERQRKRHTNGDTRADWSVATHEIELEQYRESSGQHSERRPEQSDCEHQNRAEYQCRGRTQADKELQDAEIDRDEGRDHRGVGADEPNVEVLETNDAWRSRRSTCPLRPSRRHEEPATERPSDT
jgi:hypothetical protein